MLGQSLFPRLTLSTNDLKQWMHACEKRLFGGPTLCLADLQRKRLLTGTCNNPIMIPMRHSWIFRSRWMALIWAAGIIWLAVDIAVPDDGASNTEANATDVTGAPISKDDEKALVDAINSL